VLLAFVLAGCNNAYVQMSSGTPVPTPPPPGGSLNVYGNGTSALGALLAVGLFSFMTSGGTPFYAVPPMDPERRVLEHDCTRPIEEPGANLRCR
jgi:hypothetical protein